MSDNNRLSYEQRKAMYEQNIRDTDGRRHADKLRDAPSAEINGSKNKRPSGKHKAQRIELKPPKTAQPAPQPASDGTATGTADITAGSVLSAIRRKFPKLDAPLMDYTPNSKRGRFDMPLFTVVLILIVMGIVMMSSASYAYALKEEGNSFAYAERQLVAAVIGFVLMIVLSRIDYHAWVIPIKYLGRKRREKAKNGNGLNPAMLFFVLSCGLMVAVMLFGDSVNDAKRWITIFGVQFQPSELLKVSCILMMAYMLQKNYERRSSLWYGFLKYWFVIVPAALLCYAQRHVSAMLIIMAIIFLMMYVGGCNTRGLLAIIALVILACFVLLYVVKWDYLTDRITSWTQPFSDMGDTTYQTSQSLITIGSGGWFGLGLGNSRQKYYYLPESQNDFVFSIICEELGFFGGMTVILLFVLFEIRGFIIAGKAKDKFGSLVALGITVQIGLQAILNIAVACNAIPNTGISLPFFSYGRSALLTQLAEVGILLSISKQADT